MKKEKNTYEFYKGDVVWDIGNKSYGVILNNFDNPKNGERGEIRLDSDGMQSIFDYDKNSEITGYNLVPYGSEEDKGGGDLSKLKAGATKLIESNKDYSTERYKEYSLIYCRLLSGEIDSKKQLGNKAPEEGIPDNKRPEGFNRLSPVERNQATYMGRLYNYNKEKGIWYPAAADQKKFYTQHGIGEAKYVINYYDGIQKHDDGSNFYGIRMFSNKKEFEKAQQKLLAEGYIERSGLMSLYSGGSPIEAGGDSAGKLEYKSVNTRSEKGLKEAERLKNQGWIIGDSGFETINFYRRKNNPVMTKKMVDGGSPERKLEVDRLAQALKDKGVNFTYLDENGIGINSEYKGGDIEEYDYVIGEERERLPDDIIKLIDDYNWAVDEYYTPSKIDNTTHNNNDVTTIIISDKAPLSIALQTITGKGWNTQGFEGSSEEFIENSTGRKFKTYTVKEANEKGIKEGFMIPSQDTIKDFYESAEKKGLHTTASEYMKNNWLTDNAVDSLIQAYATNMSPEEYQNLLGKLYKQQGGDAYEHGSEVTPIYIEGGAIASGFYLIYQPWDKIEGGQKGTIRTNPQNYWVASVNEDNSLVFDSSEEMIKGIDKKEVKKLWESGKISPEGRSMPKEESEYTVSKDSTEHLIDQELKPLLDKVRNKVFMPDYRAGISDADVLGIIVSKYNRWDVDLIKETCVSAFEDANFRDAAEAVSKFNHGGSPTAKQNKSVERKSDVIHTISYTLTKDVTDKTKYKRGYIQTIFSGYGEDLFPPQIKAYDLLDDDKKLIKRMTPKEAEIMLGNHQILKGQDLSVRSYKDAGTIESETPILPYVVGELVAEKAVFEKYKDQATNWKNLSQPEKDKLNADSHADIEKLANYLIERAETHYEHNPTFKKQIKSAKGLPTLYMFMYHWAGIEPEGKILASFDKNIENWEKAKKHHAAKKLSTK